MSGQIEFFSENIRYHLKERRKLRNWIKSVAENGNFRAGEISFIFCSDEYLSELNNKYLKHNTLTDIITFPLNDSDGILSGDIFISIPRVKENAKKYKTAQEIELHRVMIHGVLHLMGYGDKTKPEKLAMRVKEDQCLLLLSAV